MPYRRFDLGVFRWATLDIVLRALGLTDHIDPLLTIFLFEDRPVGNVVVPITTFSPRASTGTCRGAPGAE